MTEAEEGVERVSKKLKKKTELLKLEIQQMSLRIDALGADNLKPVEKLPAVNFDHKVERDETKVIKQQKEDIRHLEKSIEEIFGVIKHMRNDQIKALATHSLCLSCGRGDAHFMPPANLIRGGNGKYYKGENQTARTSHNKSEPYDIGRQGSKQASRCSRGKRRCGNTRSTRTCRWTLCSDLTSPRSNGEAPSRKG
jgi:hypothetical protein